MVTNNQLYIAVGIPMLFNAVLIGLLIACGNAKFKAIDVRLRRISQRLGQMQETSR